MTTAIIAKDYADAREAAARFHVGQDWVYPHEMGRVGGVTFTRVIIVSGYIESGITVEMMLAVEEQTAPNAEVIHFDPRELSFDEVIAPLVDIGNVEPEQYTPRHARKDRRHALALLGAVMLGGSVGIAGVVTLFFMGLLSWAS